jgi:tetratricopeptide (TPR) repeat protein
MKKNLLSMLSFLVLVLVLLLAAFDKPVKEQKTYNRRGGAVFCAPSLDTAKMNEPGAPLLNGLGSLKFAISTKSAKAQKYFNQGLTLLYGFNHSEAGRSFKEMIRQDSTCAMAYWGLGMVLGPNYNAALNAELLNEINTIMGKAELYASKTTAREKALVKALAKRFPKEAVSDMAPYNAAYAAGMKEAYEQFPADADMATLYADALMNEHPWDLWKKDGTAQTWTPAIQQLLEKTITMAPNHPGANHMYIHAMEASRVAAKALPSADRLRDMIPNAGHLVHMPSHIYIRTGQYHKGVIANEKATLADSTYIAQCKAQGFYPLLLYPHNIHFLAACAFFEGNSKKALDAAWMVSRKADRKYLAEVVTVQHYYIIPYYVMVHVGKWNEILELPEPGESLQYPRAIWHYARGMAFTAKGNLEQAEQELKKVQDFAANKELSALKVWDVNSVTELITIAALTLESEIALYNKQYDAAINLLTKAVDIEDRLAYQEPPDWFFSVRHSLGHVLVEARRFVEAEKVYRQDLETYPENGWALIGLHNSLWGQRKLDEAAAVKKRFQQAWKYADMEIITSRVY